MVEVVQQINMLDMGKRAKEVAFQLATFTTEQKNQALLNIADALEANRESILEANKIDIENAHANGTDPIWVRDRIDLERRMDGIINDVRHVVSLPDPVGATFAENDLDVGITLKKCAYRLGSLG